MIFKIDGEQIKITQNKLNSFWKLNGQYQNISEIKIEAEWYRCGIITLAKNKKFHIQIVNPRRVDENTSIVIEYHTEGVYKELMVPRLKLYMLQLFLNDHKLNYIFYNIRMSINERRNTIYVFSIATILSALYFAINELYSNSLMKYISENNWIQTIIIFITISGFINIFHPFTIKKQFDKKDIMEITKEKYEIDAKKKELEESLRL